MFLAPINHRYMFDSRYQCDRADMPSKLPVAARDQELPPGSVLIARGEQEGTPGMMGDVFCGSFELSNSYPVFGSLFYQNQR